MNTFGSYLKSKRMNAGLSQDKLAVKMDVSKNTIQNWESGKTGLKPQNIVKLSRILNVPESEITSEINRNLNVLGKINWPDFLFDDEDDKTNSVIYSLHLNQLQQELFGLLYIYHAEYLEKEVYTYPTLVDDLKLIPYQFIDKVGSINFLNISEKLQHVLAYVKSDFLIKILKYNPDKEFDLCRLSKDDICDFIDNGFKAYDDFEDEDCDKEPLINTAIFIDYNMAKAKIVLPHLENEKLHLTDGWWSNPLRDDFPEELLIYSPCFGKAWCRKNDPELSKYCSEQDRKSCYSGRITHGLNDLVKETEKKSEDGITRYYLEITDKGRKLLEWFRKKE